MEETSAWQQVVILGPFILAIVIIYALVRRRSLSAVEKRERQEAVDELYKDKDPKDRPPDALR